MLIAWKREASCGFSSTLTLTTLSEPARSPASCSRTGSTIRQGPHHGAQKSTRTGTLACVSAAKLDSLAGTIHGSGDLQREQRGVPRGTGPTRFFTPQDAQEMIDAISASLDASACGETPSRTGNPPDEGLGRAPSLAASSRCQP